MIWMKAIVLTICALCAAQAAIPDMDAGYVSVDPVYDSNLFWWFYGASQVSDRPKAPLTLWLQGGPGASGFYGDLAEFGPLDPFQKTRIYSWVNISNLLFVDNPVGTGFSYVGKPGKNNEGFVTSSEEAAEGLIVMLKAFLKKYPVFVQSDTPFWIFSESYGPKYATNLAVLLDKEIKSGSMTLNFKGVGLGDGWLDPLPCVHQYAPFLKSISVVNQRQYEAVVAVAEDVQFMYDQGDLAKAGAYVDNWVQGPFMAQFWPDIENYVNSPTADFDKALSEDLGPGGLIRKRWGNIIPQNVTFGGQGGNVGDALAADFLKPTYHLVDYILRAGYEVLVYGGQFDIVVNILCTDAWLKKLNWEHIEAWKDSPKQTISLSGRTVAFRQEFKNFQFWNILKAGHMVPMDQSESALLMYQSVLYSNSTSAAFTK